MYPFFRSFLFRLDPEQAHRLTLQLIRMAGSLGVTRRLLSAIYQVPPSSVSAFGLQFSNPIGLAAGYDKDGQGWQGLACLGFGHIEVGTVTPLAQPGNPRPRLFRLTEEHALINRMGFPGRGAKAVHRQLSRRRSSGLILGVNIGKNKDTPNEQAARDYVSLVKTFSPLADYLAVNVSSPNTVGLRRLQAREALESLLGAVAEEREAQTGALDRRLPVLVKLAPDLQDQELEDALEAITSSGMDGVIATNTTISRQGIRSPLAGEAGGLSGPPLAERSLQMVKTISRLTSGRLPIIGVGGISNANGAQAMLDAGALLVQVYTGLIYEGPALVKRILGGLRPPG